nr:DUF599 domain-containing protein [Kordiimonas gwangyangensis]
MDRLMQFLEYMNHADLLALAFFGVVTTAYTLVTDHSKLRARSISAAIDRQRENWMQEARRREFRMLDSNILGVLVSGVSIFASTNIFVIGGLIAGLTYNEELSAAFSSVPFADPITPGRWSIKLTLLLAIFVYAFFKFAWAIRLANYCAITVGACATRRIAGVTWLLPAPKQPHALQHFADTISIEGCGPISSALLCWAGSSVRGFSWQGHSLSYSFF